MIVRGLHAFVHDKRPQSLAVSEDIRARPRQSRNGDRNAAFKRGFELPLNRMHQRVELSARQLARFEAVP